MPKKLEKKLKAEAKKKGVKDPGAYIYGTMNKLKKKKSSKKSSSEAADRLKQIKGEFR